MARPWHGEGGPKKPEIRNFSLPWKRRLLDRRRKSKGHNVLSLMMSLALLSVIVLSLAAGVGLGYAIIFGILYAFDRSRQSARRVPAQVFNTSAGSH
jgi:hypothetical protein